MMDRDGKVWLVRMAQLAAAIAAGVVVLGVCVPADAAAQVAESLKPPPASDSDDPPTIRLYLIAALLGALVVGANLIPSKRGHQD
ncbi:MAG: hypothetical protein AAFY46_15685 [Planctomycetota bacterium]